LAKEVIAVEFVVPETQRRDVLREIEQGGGVVESSSELYVPCESDPPLDPDSRFDPLIIISCVVSVTYLLRQALRAWHDFRDNAGTVVDFRNGKVRLNKCLLAGVLRVCPVSVFSRRSRWFEGGA